MFFLFLPPTERLNCSLHPLLLDTKGDEMSGYWWSQVMSALYIILLQGQMSHCPW